MIVRGKLITFEGGEGAGKSTQAALLAQCLENQMGLTVHRTREPGGTLGAEEIRRLVVSGDVERWDPICEALLVNAARRDHCLRVIEPLLSAGTWVICDRFVDSTFVYQGVAAGLEWENLRSLHEFAVGSYWPDLTIVLDVPVDEGLLRAFTRPGSHAEARFENHPTEFHVAVREGFRQVAIAQPERCVLVEGTEAIEEVQHLIWEQVQTHLLT